ncbi:MAG: hypothetical protein IKM00_00285 [Clostridia bacterium]|nr:hypothetical protein [Clostridia bacterium]
MQNADRTIVRELAKQYAELANSDEQKRSHRRMRDSNDLKIVRPPVLIDEIPWHELTSDDSLVCRCEDPLARRTEWFFRRSIFQKKHFRTDLLMPDYWKVRMAYEISPLGVEKQVTQSAARAKSFLDVLEEEESLDLIREPSFCARPDLDERNMNFFTDLFQGILPVRLVGANCMYMQFWDDISELRGVEPIYEDMYDRPEYLHRIMQTFVRRASARMDFLERHFHVDNDPISLHCTPGMISGLAQDGLKATWYRGMAQPFSCVSPAMFKEFEFDYIKPLAERCAYTYYGCCEPLDNRIEILKGIRNLRKIGVSPWANEALCAEQIGGDYVFARKPNPANVAYRTDPDVIRRETENTVKLCLRYGCPLEFVLKDVTTVSRKPENLILWANTVSETLDQYYEKA